MSTKQQRRHHRPKKGNCLKAYIFIPESDKQGRTKSTKIDRHKNGYKKRKQKK